MEKNRPSLASSSTRDVDDAGRWWRKRKERKKGPKAKCSHMRINIHFRVRGLRLCAVSVVNVVIVWWWWNGRKKFHIFFLLSRSYIFFSGTDKREVKLRNPPVISSYSCAHFQWTMLTHDNKSDKERARRRPSTPWCVRFSLVFFPLSTVHGWFSAEKFEPFFCAILRCLYGEFSYMRRFSLSSRSSSSSGDGCGSKREQESPSRLFWNGWMNFYRTSAFKYNGDLVKCRYPSTSEEKWGEILWCCHLISSYCR